METTDFSTQLSSLISQKAAWFNDTELPKMLEAYRLLNTCVKNLYDFLTQKSAIPKDPYRLDRKISEITAPDSSAYMEPERNVVIGTRFSDYDTMVDFVVTYTRFTVESITLPRIKKLQDLNATFLWDELTTNSSKPNTRGLAHIISDAKVNSQPMVISMLNDNVAKCAQAIGNINGILAQLSKFQREAYKASIRSELLAHPSFNREKAMSSPDAEMAEIKRLFSEAVGKKPFYTELINEIIAEDQDTNKEKLRQTVIDRLQIKELESKKKKTTIDTKAILMNSINILGALAPIYQALYNKISDNLKLMHSGKKNGFAALLAKLFHIKPKEIQFNVTMTDPITKQKSTKKLNVDQFMEDVLKKQRIYSGIANRGPEYSKINAANETQILNFLGKQISENQNLFNTFVALDEYFKTNVPSSERLKVKGSKIEIDSLRNTIISANKKRGEYQSIVEETEQMKKLGITND